MQRVRIGDLCSYAKGLSIPRDRTDPDNDIAYLHYGDLYKKYDFRLNLDEVWDDIIKIDSNERYKPEQVLYDGDIVFTLTSESVEDLGHSTLVINKNNLPFVSGMETTILHIIDKNRCLPSYLNYVFQSNWFRQVLRQYVTGMKVYRVHPRDLMDIEVPLPDLSRQHEVCNLLNPISDCIDVNTKINDYLSDLASEIFNHYIGSIRSKMPFENLISLGSGGTPRTSVSEYWNGQIPFFSPKDVSGCYVYKTEKNITQDGLNNCNSRLYPQNTIIITARGTVGKICLTAKPMAMNQSCYAVLSKNGTVYTTYLLCKYIVKKLKHKASGAVFDAITAQDILKEEIPNIDSTTAIMLESRLSHIFTMILKIGEESARLIQIRDCLLKDLFLSSR